LAVHQVTLSWPQALFVADGMNTIHDDTEHAPGGARRSAPGNQEE